MISDRVTRPARIAALFAVLLDLAAGSIAADLASTYAHDAFPSAPAESDRRPCRQERLTRKSHRVRRAPAAAVRRGSAAPSPDASPSERPERPGVVSMEDDANHR